MRLEGRRTAVFVVLGLTLVGAMGLAGIVMQDGGGLLDEGAPSERADPPGTDGPIAPVSRNLRGPSGESGGDAGMAGRGEAGPGEDATEAEPGDLDSISVEVTGVSGALRPHLVVMFQPVGDRSRWQAVPCDAAGVATLRGELPERLQLGLFQTLVSDLRLQDAAGGSFTWDVDPGARLHARPAEPIAGVQRATRTDGVTPRLKLAFGPEQDIGPAREVQIARRAHLDAAEWLYLWSEDTGGFRVRPRDLLRPTDDLWLADPARGEALARLRLVVPGDRLAEARRLEVLLSPSVGGQRVHLHLDQEERWQGTAFVADRIPAGTWRAEWRSGARVLGALAAEVVLRAGEETVLSGTPPSVVRWQGEVSNWRQVPEPVRTRHVLYVAGTLAEVDDEGAFTVELPADLPPSEMQVEFRGGAPARGLPGRVVTLDARAGTMVVEHPPVEDFGVVRVTVEPALEGSIPGVVVLRGLDRRVPTLHRANWYHHGGYRVAVEGDVVELPRWETGPLTGALVESAGGGNQVTAWFSVPGGATHHTVRGTGRWVTLHLHREVARAQVYVQGPAGQPALFVAEMQGPGELPVWSVPGTGTVLVDLGGGEVRRLAVQGDELHVW